jgi:predicted nucleic acid-binding protein
VSPEELADAAESLRSSEDWPSFVGGSASAGAVPRHRLTANAIQGPLIATSSPSTAQCALLIAGRSSRWDIDAQGAVALAPMVVAELVSGARLERQRAAIAELVRDLPIHETPLDHWIRVGDLRRRLAEKGVAVSTPDAHVAQCAIDRAAVLLTRDDVFNKIAKATPLRVFIQR